MEKSLLRQALVEKLTAELEVLTRAALMARDEATNEESKAEGKYDTRGQEAAYLAEGQAKLAVELQESVVLYQSLPLSDFAPHDAADIGAVVTLETRGRSSHYFLGPRNGGIELSVAGRELIVVTPQSPLGRQLLGRRVGETVQLPGRSGPVAHRVTAIE